MCVKIRSFLPARFSTVVFISLTAITPIRAQAADTQAPAALAPATSLQQAAQTGADLFTHDSFGGAGTCETCHSHGGRTAGQVPGGPTIPSLTTAAADFPRYVPRAHAVITLTQQINNCIAGALGGQPPAPGSPEMVDLETYLTALSKGAVIGKQF